LDRPRLAAILHSEFPSRAPLLPSRLLVSGLGAASASLFSSSAPSLLCSYSVFSLSILANRVAITPFFHFLAHNIIASRPSLVRHLSRQLSGRKDVLIPVHSLHAHCNPRLSFIIPTSPTTTPTTSSPYYLFNRSTTYLQLLIHLTSCFAGRFVSTSHRSPCSSPGTRFLDPAHCETRSGIQGLWHPGASRWHSVRSPRPTDSPTASHAWDTGCRSDCHARPVLPHSGPDG
jgi:hypothetical protein